MIEYPRLNHQITLGMLQKIKEFLDKTAVFYPLMMDFCVVGKKVAAIRQLVIEVEGENTNIMITRKRRILIILKLLIYLMMGLSLLEALYTYGTSISWFSWYDPSRSGEQFLLFIMPLPLPFVIGFVVQLFIRRKDMVWWRKSIIRLYPIFCLISTTGYVLFYFSLSNGIIIGGVFCLAMFVSLFPIVLLDVYGNSKK